MAPSAGFWKSFKKTLFILIVLGIVAAVLCFVLLPGNKGIFFGGGTLILVLNLVLMLIFTCANDNKRPKTRHEKEAKRFDFHRDR